MFLLCSPGAEPGNCSSINVPKGNSINISLPLNKNYDVCFWRNSSTRWENICSVFKNGKCRLWQNYSVVDVTCFKEEQILMLLNISMTGIYKVEDVESEKCMKWINVTVVGGKSGNASETLIFTDLVSTDFFSH